MSKNLTAVTPVFPGDAADASSVSGASASVKSEAKKHSLLVLATLCALMGFASISTDLYLPAMPEMERVLKANAGMLEWTVSGYLIGFSLGQLLWEPIGDRYGRRLPVAIGLILFAIGSAGCALSTSASIMIGWRVVQAIGASAGVVLARAMVRDLYEGNRAAQMLSTLMTVMGIAPLIGPLLGGQILALSGWRAIFWFLVGVAALTLVAIITMSETLPLNRRNNASLSRALASYWELVKHPRILAYAGAGGFLYSGMFAYIAGTPFAYINYHHVAAQHYGFLFAVGIIGIMGANAFNAKFVSRFGGTRLLTYGTIIAAVSGVSVFATAYSDFGGLWGLVVPLFAYMSMAGFVVANSIGGALSDFPKQAGAVSALVGTLQYGSGIIGSALVGVFANGTPWPMGAVIAVSGMGSFLCAKALR